VTSPVDHEPGQLVGDDSGAKPHDREDEIARRLDELADLFTRRLADDRARRVAVEELTERLRQAELGPFRQVLHPFVHGVALVVDRLDRYTGADPEFAASIRDELVDVLTRHGVREVPVADGFDPATQEAVETRHDPDAPAGAVLEVQRTGFAHGGWVFRPAQVVVNTDGS
jgi:molecular chaperone GrpE (heat shock protein)